MTGVKFAQCVPYLCAEPAFVISQASAGRHGGQRRCGCGYGRLESWSIKAAPFISFKCDGLAVHYSVDVTGSTSSEVAPPPLQL